LIARNARGCGIETFRTALSELVRRFEESVLATLPE
jgi:hypothetical protein